MSMKKKGIEATINPGGKTCTTVEPMTPKEYLILLRPSRYTFDAYEEAYKQGKAERQTLEIENQESVDHFVTEAECCGNPDNSGYCCNNPRSKEVYNGTEYRYSPGQTVEIEILPNRKVRIL